MSLISKKSFLSNGNVRYLTTTNFLEHAPGLKKKQNTQVDQKKIERQRILEESKLWKQIITPPIDPESVPQKKWYESNRQRINIIFESEAEKRELILKEWAKFQMKEHKKTLQSIRDKIKCREKAMKELEKESAFLYDAALDVDTDIFPFILKGPVVTPPVEGYEAPDFVDEKKI